MLRIPLSGSLTCRGPVCSCDPWPVPQYGQPPSQLCVVPAGCATVAEVRKRGDDFWGEFEFYLSDLVVGCVLDCVLVGLLAPAAVIGAKPKSKPSGKQHALLLACWTFRSLRHLLPHHQLCGMPHCKSLSRTHVVSTSLLCALKLHICWMTGQPGSSQCHTLHEQVFIMQRSLIPSFWQATWQQPKCFSIAVFFSVAMPWD